METRNGFFSCEASALLADIVEGKADSPGRYVLPSTADDLSAVLPVNGVVASIVLSEGDFGSVSVLL